MADPTVATTGLIARSQADANFNVFQPVNGFGGAQLSVGNIFLGINGGCVFKFTDAGIPKGSTIKSAVVDVVADATSGATAVTAQIQGVAMGPDKAWVPPRYGLSTPKWRPEIWGAFAADVRNLAAATIVDTVPGATNGVWGMRQLLQYRQKLAQRFTVPAGGGDTLGDIRLELTRAGAPPGTLSLEVRVPRDNLPEGELLAVSDTVVAAAVPAGPSDVTFSFSGANQIALEENTTYFVVLKSDLPYPTNGADWIGWRISRAFFGPGGGRHFGVGSDFDNQNYPEVGDVFQAATDQVGVDVNWAMPPFVLGVTYTTPDITEIVQAIVSDQYYQSGSPIGIAFNSVGNAGVRRIASFTSVRDSAVLRVEYCPPDNNLQTNSGSLALYKPQAPEIPLPTGIRLPEWAFDPNLGREPVQVDQARWIDFSALAQLPTGPAVNDYTPPPPKVVEQGRDVAVPPTKAPGLQTGHEPAPPPRVQPQHRPEQIDAIPQKRPGPAGAPVAPAGGQFTPQADWLRVFALDTTPLRTDARSDAPPTVSGTDDLFPTRRVAPPPPADPARRSVRVPGVEQPQNLKRFVYDWARSVLRWEAVQHQLGTRNPLPRPGLLQIPPEFAWAHATRERVDLKAAWRAVLSEARSELARLLAGTDNPPRAWAQAQRYLRPSSAPAGGTSRPLDAPPALGPPRV